MEGNYNENAEEKEESGSSEEEPEKEEKEEQDEEKESSSEEEEEEEMDDNESDPWKPLCEKVGEDIQETYLKENLVLSTELTM